jgi:hypothetical protein
MDPRNIMNVLSNIAQLVEFGGMIISKSTQICRSPKGSLTGNVDVELATEDLRTLISKLKSTSPSADEPLKLLSDSCETVAKELLEVLDKLKVKEKKHRKWQSIRLALLSEMKKEEIKDLEDRLSRFRDQLNLRITTDIR